VRATILTRGYKLGSPRPERRRFGVWIHPDAENVQAAIQNAIKMLEGWSKVPLLTRLMRTTDYKRYVLSFCDRCRPPEEGDWMWWIGFCWRHKAPALYEGAWVWDNKRRLYSLQEKVVILYTCTNAHEFFLRIDGEKVTMIADGVRFTYRKHRPYSTYHYICHTTINSLKYLLECLEAPETIINPPHKPYCPYFALPPYLCECGDDC